jgi:hypothetical protein
MTDPLITPEMVRATLRRLAERDKETYAGLSRMLRRDDRYLDTFVRAGRPERLTARDIETLAGYFRIDQRLLGGKRSLTAKRERFG